MKGKDLTTFKHITEIRRRNTTKSYKLLDCIDYDNFALCGAQKFLIIYADLSLSQEQSRM